MSRRRFYAPPETFAPDGKSLMLDGEEARHLRVVLRLGRGAEVFVFDGRGREYRCVIDQNEKGVARLSVLDEVAPAQPESPLELTLGLALLKGEKFDLVVQKATELGVARIVPMQTRLADVRVKDAGDTARRVVRWQRIALEAAKQSGRARVPDVSAPAEFMDLAAAPSSSAADEWRVMFTEREGTGLLETIERGPVRPRAVTALVGSEGGWTDEELELARASGWSQVTLGGRLLRAETAAITVVALLQHLLGDLK